MTGQAEEWVEIGFTHHRDEAQAWRDLLLSSGIQARLRPDLDLVDAYPGTDIMGPYHLQVPKDLESEARAALEDIRNPQNEGEESD